MFLFFAIYVGQGRPRLEIVTGASTVGVIAARAWARRPPREPFSRLPVHLAIASAVAAVIGGALLRGQSASLVQYYLVLVPAFAACLLPVRATFGWTLVAVAGFFAIDRSEQFWTIPPEGFDRPYERLLSQSVLVLMVFGASWSQWRTTENHVAALREREQQIREQANELATTRDAALRASKIKSEFLATMSHEIRTPMNAVIGLTDLILATKLDAEQRDLLETARRSSETMVEILNDILDFSKIESDRIELEERTVSLRSCIEEALELLAPRATERNVELLYDHPAHVIGHIEGDPMRLRQIVVNLVSNAIKFTKDGDVTIRADELEGDGESRRIRISVRDTGIGIPADRRERLFQPFSQVDASTTRRFGGTGLGLAISRRLVERMGGEIGVESEPGRGSRFWFTLPVRFAPPSPNEIRFDAKTLAGKSLLIVHRHAGQRALLERDGADRGWRIRGVGSLLEAIERLRAGAHFDGLLVDARCLVSEGIDAAREVVDEVAGASILLASPGDLPAGVEAEALEIFSCRRGRPVRTKRLAETFANLWLHPAEAASSKPETRALEDDALALRVPLRILIAEDNAVNQRVVRLMLERLGYRPDVVDDGAKAVAAAREGAYDLILMDMQMPELDGVDAAREIRASGAATPRPRIVALTANALAEDRRRCLEAGMDDFLAKPLRARELREALLRCIPS
jgi:signal transduction histidine kinase